jgi:hypothetical protein
LVKKALMLLGVLAIVGVAGLSLLLPDAVSASGHSATRSFATNTVVTGAELEIEISVSGLGGFGQVRETLPEGFSFTGSDESAVVDGQTVSFTVLNSEATFSYTVTAPAATGTYEFSGSVLDSDKEAEDTGGDSSIEVTDPPLVAERSISRSSVGSGEQITISIAASGFGAAASVVENVPAGLSYTASSLSSAAVNVGEGSLRFTLLGEDSFTYTLTAGEPGDYTISGTITDLDKVALDITGDDSVTVSAAVPATADRSFGAAFAEPEGEVVVTIAAAGYGPAAQIVETIPEGFTYVSTDLPGGATDTDGQSLTFVILGEDSFTYTVTAPADTGVYAFSGSLTDIEKNESPVGGTIDLKVGAPPAFPESEMGIREIAENTDAGVDIGDPVAAESTVGALTYEITGDDAPDFDIDTATGQLKTKSALDYETKASYSVSVTATDELGSTASLDVAVQVTNVYEGIMITDSGVREINENTPFGVRIGDPIAASSAVSALTFEITSAAADTFDIEPDTGQLRTKGDLDFESRASYSLQVTITDEYGESASLVVTIKVLDRDEYVEPTATPEPTAVPPTAVPPTAVPPTATSVPPTATSVPPTATVAPEPTVVPEPEDEGGFPVWAIIVIVLAVIAGVAIIGFVIYRRRQA